MKNKSTLVFYTYTLLSICIALFSTNADAQENGIYEIAGNNNAENDREDFYELTYQLKPTAYIENNNVKLGGNGGYDNLPIVKLTFNDAKSFNILNQQSIKLNKVELMTIKLSTAADLNNRINLIETSGLNRLKYIFIECAFECTESQINQFITYDNSIIRVFYKINKPS